MKVYESETAQTRPVSCCFYRLPAPAALKNPEVVAKRGGLSTILKSVIDCQLSRINEALITTVLHLLNHPRTRQYVRVDVELEVRADLAAGALRVVPVRISSRLPAFFFPPRSLE